MKLRLCLCVLLLSTAACMQEPAEIEYRGNEFYGHEHGGALDTPDHETYPENSPRYKEGYTRPVEPAQVQSVGVSDLPPPTPAAQNPAQEHTLQEHPRQEHTLQPHTLREDAPAQNAHLASPPADDAHVNKFIWPVAGGKVISHFGSKPGGKSNDGINIALAEGEPIWASAGGTVVYAGNELKGYGNMVIIRHSGGWMTAYAHARSISVRKDDKVKQADIIGYVGQTGGVKSPQLHFALRDGRQPVDPEKHLSPADTGNGT